MFIQITKPFLFVGSKALLFAVLVLVDLGCAAGPTTAADAHEAQAAGLRVQLVRADASEHAHRVDSYVAALQELDPNESAQCRAQYHGVHLNLTTLLREPDAMNRAWQLIERDPGTRTILLTALLDLRQDDTHQRLLNLLERASDVETVEERALLTNAARVAQHRL